MNMQRVNIKHNILYVTKTVTAKDIRTEMAYDTFYALEDSALCTHCDNPGRYVIKYHRIDAPNGHLMVYCRKHFGKYVNTKYLGRSA